MNENEEIKKEASPTPAVKRPARTVAVRNIPDGSTRTAPPAHPAVRQPSAEQKAHTEQNPASSVRIGTSEIPVTRVRSTAPEQTPQTSVRIQSENAATRVKSAQSKVSPAVKPTTAEMPAVKSAPTVKGQNVPSAKPEGEKSFKKGFTVLAAVSAMLLIVCVGLLVVFIGQSKSDGERISKSESEINDLESKRDALEKERDALISERDSLSAQVDELSKDSDERIIALQKEIDEKTALMEELNGTLESYRSIYAVDVRRQVELVNELNELIEDGAPLHNLKEGVDPEVTKVGDLKEDGTEITEKDLYEYPKISVYYEDLATGFKYTYDADRSVYTASVVKALYVVSLLEDASNAYEKAVENRKNAEDPLEFDNKSYDLENTKWTMTAADKKDGSGDLSGMEAGTEFTLLELVEHTIVESDNTAFYRLREIFGYDSFNALARKLGASSLSYSFNTCSAADVGKFMRHIYEFIESDAKYAPNLKEYMSKSKHRVMIPLAVSPTPTLHKYGWDTDSYHDAGIVLEDKPYIIVVFTDMDEGGDDVNEFIRSIIQTVAKLHKNFYG